MATLIDGKAIAAGLRAKVGAEVSELKARHNITPGLAVVLVAVIPLARFMSPTKARCAARQA